MLFIVLSSTTWHGYIRLIALIILSDNNLHACLFNDKSMPVRRTKVRLSVIASSMRLMGGAPRAPNAVKGWSVPRSQCGWWVERHALPMQLMGGAPRAPNAVNGWSATRSRLIFRNNIYAIDKQYIMCYNLLEKAQRSQFVCLLFHDSTAWLLKCTLLAGSTIRRIYT